VDSYEVVIVGGGVVGSAVAYFLAADPDFAGRVLVVERDPTYATATTALSVGSIRQQFSTPENVRMSLFGAEFFDRIGDFLGIEGEVPDISHVVGGYLFLASEAGMPILESNHRVQRALGAENVLLDAAQLAERFPWLATDDLAGGSLGLRHEGWVDPYSLLQAFRRKARSLGVEYAHDEAVGLERAGGRIVAVRLARRGAVGCGAVVNAGGAHAGAVARLAGVELPVRPRKRFVYVFDCRTRVPCRELVIDPTGVYFRPEGRHFIGGVSPPADRDPDCLDLEVEYELFEETVWPTLAHRVPAFAEIKLMSAWAGLYDYNTIDQNAIIGPHPELANLLFANGFSGHGLQQSPATGRAIAELVIHGRYKTLDLSRFSYERFARGELVREINVV
jgi:FAD-dependent oxidoreductase domain-containing protein 1